MEKEEFIAENYIKEEVIVNIIWANIFGIIVLIISLIIFGIPFFFIWIKDIGNIIVNNPEISLQGQIISKIKNICIFLLILIPCIALHELIHGIFFSLFAKNRFKSIKFGFLSARKLFTPYCHCKDELRINHYQIGLIMPLVIMGIIPSIISIVTGNIQLLFYGLLLVVAGSGDVLIFIKTLKEVKNCWIIDHPTEAGYYVYKLINGK